MIRKLIIFDLDGVLFDSIAIASKYNLDKYPGATHEMFKEVLKGNFHEEIKKLAHLRKEESEEAFAERQLLYAKKKSETPMYAGAKELLEKLHREGCHLALNTVAHNRNCLPLLEKAGITSLFDFLATAETSKRKVDNFKIIEEKYGLAAKDMLFVTDTLGDVREAEVANIPTVAVTWGAHDRSYFTQEEHGNLIGIVDSFDELETFIREYSKS